MTAASLDLGAVLAGPAPAGGARDASRAQGALSGADSFAALFHDLQSLPDTARRDSSDSGAAGADPSAADPSAADGQSDAESTPQTSDVAGTAASGWHGPGFTADDATPRPTLTGGQPTTANAAESAWAFGGTYGAFFTATATASVPGAAPTASPLAAPPGAVTSSTAEPLLAWPQAATP
ncbi:MAG: hypothetical protein ABIO34_00055, partial [Arthrobacter oryzae]